MIRWILPLLLASPVWSGEASLRDRIQALRDPEFHAPQPDSLYREQIAQDLVLIGREADLLFGEDRHVQIALFVSQNCDACDKAQDELSQLTKRLDVPMKVLDADMPLIRAAQERLTLDMLPAYVMTDRMIRGHIPAFVLERYLKEAR